MNTADEFAERMEQHSPQERKPIAVLKELSDDEVKRMLFEKQEIARMDIESRMADERRKFEGVIADLRDTVADKDAEIADNYAKIADKDAEIADNYAEIARLRAQLEKRNG